MHRYRLNVKFLIIMAVTFVAVLGGGYGLWAFQVYKSAPGLKKDALAAVEEQDYQQAGSLWRRYINLRPNDVDAQLQHAEAELEFIKQPQAQLEDQIRALAVAEKTLRENPIPRDEKEWDAEMKELAPKIDKLREDTARVNLRFGRWSVAMDHLDYLIDKRMADKPEFEVLRLRCLIGDSLGRQAVEKGFELIGYDEISKEFDVGKAIAPREPAAYVLLAASLRRFQSRDQLADEVMNQLVAANPESSEAFLERSVYWQQRELLDLAKEDWEKAYQLDGQDGEYDISLLLNGSQLHIALEEKEESLRLAKDAVAAYPENYRPYLQLAQAYAVSDDRSMALETVDEGLKKVETAYAQMQLMIFKLDLQFNEQKVAEGRATIEQFRQGFQQLEDLARYFEARALLVEKRWVDALEILNAVRPAIAQPKYLQSFPKMLASLDRYRGTAYNAIGQRDQAMNAWQLSLDAFPGQPQLANALAVLQRQTGRVSDTQAVSLASQVSKMKELPASQQNWARVEEFIRKDVEAKHLSEVQTNLYWAEYYYYRDRFEKAFALLKQTLEMNPNEGEVIGAIRLSRVLPDAGPSVAHQLIDQAIERYGDNQLLRLERAAAWVQEGGDDLVSKLWTLTDDTEQWTEQQQAFFYNQLADTFRQIGKPDEAAKALAKVIDAIPQDVGALLEMFALARTQRDNEAMQRVQQQILDIVKSKDHDTWQYTEAARLLTLYVAGLRDEKMLSQAASLIDSIEKKRPQWHEVYRLKGDLLTLQNNLSEAVQSYNRALDLGPPSALAIRQHAHILFLMQQYSRAKSIAEKLAEPSRVPILGTLYAEILLNSAQSTDKAAIGKAFDVADEVVKQNENDPSKHVWLADLMTRHNRIQLAEPHLRKALELDPSEIRYWAALAKYLAFTQQREAAEQVLRDAQLVLPEGDVSLLLAEGFSLLGRWRDAEQEYLNAYRADPGNLNRARILANFYLSKFIPDSFRRWGYSKAIPHVNEILRQADSTTDQETVRWARRTAAGIFARTGDYQNMLKAQQLLQANAIDGQLPREDRLQMAELLAGRPEPGSRTKAIQLLEEAKKQRPLELDHALVLAKLYWNVDRQNDARDQILNVVARYGNIPSVWQTYVAMLVNRGKYDDAEEYFRKNLAPTLPNPLTMASLTDQNFSTLELGVRIWNKTNQNQRALATLLGLLPKTADDIAQEQVIFLPRIAALLLTIDEVDTAGKVFQLYASKRKDRVLEYIKFVGAYQDVEDAYKYLEQIAAQSEDGQLFPVIEAGLAIINARRDEIGDSKDATIELWMARALRENPDSSVLLGLKADLLEMQQEYDEAEKMYERILALPGFKGEMRARVLNNLAFLLALQDRNLNRAMDLIEQAVSLRGPSTDILDTRAVVQIARRNFNAAINDLELAVTDRPTAEKWFHLSYAYWLAGRRDDAQNAWDRANDFGVGKEKLKIMEHQRYEQFRKQIESARQTQGRKMRNNAIDVPTLQVA